MRPEIHRSSSRNHGFTLVETLVALTIVSVLIASLIPISRNTLFRVVALKEEALRLDVLQSLIREPDILSAADRGGRENVKINTQIKALAPFEYDKDQMRSWQPVLITIEIKSVSGGITRTELIRLEPADR